MLVLTQKEGEVLQIGDDVRIYIKRVKGNMVRLCIDAPREIPILRVPQGNSGKPASPRTDEGDASSEDSLSLDLRPSDQPPGELGGPAPTETEVEDSDGD